MIVELLLGLFGLTVSCIFLFSLLFYLYLGYTSKKWIKINTNIFSIEINDEAEYSAKANDVIEYFKYYVNVKYEYIIKDKKYKSSNIGYFVNFKFDNKENAKKLVDKLIISSNDNIQIYVHPHFNNFSVILPGIYSSTMLKVLLTMSIFGILFFVFFLLR